MRAARRRNKSKFTRKLKSIFLFSFISIFVIGFVVNVFFSNIIDYSFALANSGGVVDFKSDEKYSVVLIDSNTLGEVKEFSMLVFDKKNSSISEFILNPEIELSTSEGDDFVLKNLFNNFKKSDINGISKSLSYSFATQIGFVYIGNTDEVLHFKEALLGNMALLELYSLTKVENINLRDTFTIYSFSSKVDSKDKKQKRIATIANLDKELRDIYLDSVVGDEAKSITVVNTTNVNGLAKEYSRAVLNLGGRVVDLTSNTNNESESFLIYKEKSKTLDEIASRMGISKKVSFDEIGLKYPEIIKSDIVLVAGLDKK